jgi:hypothetical protein
VALGCLSFGYKQTSRWLWVALPAISSFIILPSSFAPVWLPLTWQRSIILDPATAWPQCCTASQQHRDAPPGSPSRPPPAPAAAFAAPNPASPGPKVRKTPARGCRGPSDKARASPRSQCRTPVPSPTPGLGRSPPGASNCSTVSARGTPALSCAGEARVTGATVGPIALCRDLFGHRPSQRHGLA